MFRVLLALSIVLAPMMAVEAQARGVKKKLTAAEKKDYRVVVFGADWCGPCLRMKPHFKTNRVKAALKSYKKNEVGTPATNKYHGQHYFYIDSDVDRREPDSWQLKYKVISIPTVLILDKNNKVVRRGVGYMSEAQLYNFLSDASVTTVNGEVAEETFTFGAVTILKWVVILLARGLLFFLQ